MSSGRPPTTGTDSPMPSQRMADLAITPTLLSPSKARAAAASTASWIQIDAWLKQLFDPTKVPRFERNESTQAALLALISANESADEERRLLREARVEALASLVSSHSEDGGGRRRVFEEPGHANETLEELKSGEQQQQQRGATPRFRLLHYLESSLPKSSQSNLNSLATAAVLLPVSSSLSNSAVNTSNIYSFSSPITHLTESILDAEIALDDIKRTQNSLDRDIKRLEDSITQHSNHITATIEDVDADTDAISQTEKLQSQTVAMNRETKAVAMKLAEYQERIKVLQGYDIGSIRIEDVIKKEEQVRRQEEQMRILEAKIIAMHGLPPDLDVSRKEVERARIELEGWKKRRDEAFEHLVE